jgi:hypothetical protein
VFVAVAVATTGKKESAWVCKWMKKTSIGLRTWNRVLLQVPIKEDLKIPLTPVVASWIGSSNRQPGKRRDRTGAGASHTVHRASSSPRKVMHLHQLTLIGSLAPSSTVAPAPPVADEQRSKSLCGKSTLSTLSPLPSTLHPPPSPLAGLGWLASPLAPCVVCGCSPALASYNAVVRFFPGLARALESHIPT